MGNLFKRVKSLAILFTCIILAIIVLPFDSIAQDSVRVSLPAQFDFSTITATYQTGQTIINTLIVLGVGYLSPYIPFVKNLSSASRRVLIAVLPILIVIGLFGFNNDVKMLLFQVFGSIITGGLVYDKVLQPIGLSTPKPILIDSADDIKI